MKAKSIKLQNFRNYKSCIVDFHPGKNIVIGDNAQGKTNLLEAVDLFSTGKSSRATEDRELVLWGNTQARAELHFESKNYDGTLQIDWTLKEASAPGSGGRCQKAIKVNGVSQSSVKGLLGRIITVSFSANDMRILRSGPKHRRDWLDDIAVRLKPAFHDSISGYAKSVLQRNKLLKTLAERGRLSTSDQDELLVWDKQLAKYGTYIIKARLKLLDMLLPIAEEHQAQLSKSSEKLSIDYAFRAQEEAAESSSSAGDEDSQDAKDLPLRSMEELQAMENVELAQLLLKLMKERRWLELRRRQSLVGPHRDNLIFKINGASAVAFASQGQQRSIVLSLKMAELKMVSEQIGEPPILLLDDVLAELDEKRAALLLSAVTGDMQTIMSTTHLSAIDESWLSGAQIMTVEAGELKTPQKLS